MNQRRRVVVTGLGLSSCFGSDTDKFYDQLLAGKSGVGPLTHFPCEDYETRIAAEVTDFEVGNYMDRKQVRRVDPCIRYGIVAGKKALEDAQLVGDAIEKLDKTRAGVILGSGMGGMHIYTEGVKTLHEKGHNRMSPFFIPFIITNMPGAMLAKDVGFMGPNYSISTACATGNNCIIAAGSHIRNGEADLMLCGGVEAPIIPVGVGGFLALKALSRNNENPEQASRPFDTGRDGFVMGEGAGVLVLEELEHAKARGAHIYGEYLGGGNSCDAYHLTSPREDGRGVALCIESALKDAQVEKSRVNYINAHATSTPVGDKAEITAIQSVFTKYDHLKMNASKSMIGHCLGAAGGIEAVITVKAIERDEVHPTINLDNPEPMLKIDPVAHVSQKWDIDVALSNSFGFGGHNSSVVFSKFKG